MRTTLEDRINSRDNNFDFIRFCAASLVVFSHTYGMTGMGEKEPIYNFSHHFFFTGTLCVIIFFNISGFLIARSYANATSFKQYAFARILRIYPGLIIVTLLTVFVLGPVFTTLSLKSYFTNSQTLQYLLNVFSIKIHFLLPGLFAGNPMKDGVNGCLWSLPYELSCYVLIAFIGYVKDRQVKLSIALLLLLAFMYYFIISIGPTAGIILIQYSCYFLGGSLLYYFRKYIVLNHLLTLALILILAAALYFNVYKHIKNLMFIFFMPYILVNLAYIKSPLNKFAKYGDFSYGIYIYGWPIQQIISQLFPGFNFLQNFAASFVLILAIAYLSWHLVENRFLKYKNKFR